MFDYSLVLTRTHLASFKKISISADKFKDREIRTRTSPPSRKRTFPLTNLGQAGGRLEAGWGRPEAGWRQAGARLEAGWRQAGSRRKKNRSRTASLEIETSIDSRHDGVSMEGNRLTQTKLGMSLTPD